MTPLKNKDGETLDWEQELTPQRKELVKLVSDLDEHYGEYEGDPNKDTKGDSLISKVKSFIKKYKVPESVFNSVAKDFKGLDLVFSDFK